LASYAPAFISSSSLLEFMCQLARIIRLGDDLGLANVA
jgi:hypothetical protein